jgi:hypothetical protein
MTSSAVLRPGRLTPRLLLGLFLASGLLAGGYYFFWRPTRDDQSAPADPRLTYRGPYRNIHPDVRYVGDAACAGCHDDQCEKFHQHAMGRSILTVADWLASAKIKPVQPFEKLGSRFEAEVKSQQVWHKQEHLDKNGKPATSIKNRVDFVIGSGHRGHSFFTTRDGFLFQTPISWFTQKGMWDLSPGFRSVHLRPVTAECLFCHSGGAKPIEPSTNHFEESIFTSPSITCERCHGPASLHVEERNRTLKVKLPDYTIVNPKHLSPALREDVCHQCHLSGEVKVLRRGRDTFDYRPGLPLSDFWSIYVATPDIPVKQRAVGHVEQLMASKCFTRSEGRLGCATCHDPHEALPVEQRVSHHRRKCLECHETKTPCSLDRTERLKTSKEDSCINCHMKRLEETDIAHTAVTDHRILRLPRQPSRPGFPEPPALPTIPLECFHKDRRGEEDAERDLGMAVVRAAQSKPKTFGPALPRALVLLEKACKRVPDDVPMLENLGECLLLMSLPERAMEVIDRILALQPRNPKALFTAGQLHFQLNHFGRAVEYLEKARAEEPWSGVIASFLVLSLVKKQDYGRAAEVCKAWLEFEPEIGETWSILAHCQRKIREPEEAAESQKKADCLGAPRFTE